MKKDLSPRRTAEIDFWADGSKLMVRFQNHETGERSGILTLKKNDRSTVADRLSKLASSLEAVGNRPIWSKLRDDLTAHPDPSLRASMAQCVEQIASDGSSLYTFLSEDPGFKPVLELANALPEGSTITIWTNFAFFPWEMLYPRAYSIDWTKKQKAEQPVDRHLFWGYRFHIECLSLPQDDDPYKPPTAAYYNGPSYISIGLNPTIDEELRTPGLKPIKLHQDLYNERIGTASGQLLLTGEEIKNMLLSNSSATMIYLYCHGSSDQPFNPTQVAKLEVDKDQFIDPQFLSFESEFSRGPIIFINSCSSGSYSPLSVSTFLVKFQKKRAMGVVGTTIPMPIRFAAMVGTQLINDYIDGLSLGTSLYELRRALLDAGNPLGLFYCLQCPLHVKSPSGAPNLAPA